jgi:hypothetical protein
MGRHSMMGRLRRGKLSFWGESMLGAKPLVEGNVVGSRESVAGDADMRRDNASTYLDGLIAAARRLKGRWFGHMTLGLLGDSDAHLLSPSTDVELNPALQAAYQDFGLNSKDPAH